ncbi:hypothetical protein AB0J72_34360 [Dactylosporangium sp. NPDC049742]|uniref:hypothetical protein n=1 Tax=Dactylosporangium sp. NPDC049742 TaxID=3154737 RepID=UPI003418BB39
MSEVDHVRLERIAAKLAVASALQREERTGPWRDNAAEEAAAQLARDVPRVTADNFGQASGR